MKKLNILIVEDEIIIYMHITKTLEELGFENIFVARSSKEALEIASKNSIDILFSDINIEGDVDGIDTATILQKQYGLPVIFITAYKDKEMLRRVSKIDIIGYLLKPYRVDELEALIELTISKYELDLEQKQIQINENYSYDKKTKKLYFQNEEVNLTKKESILFSILVENLNDFVSYELLENLVWYDEVIADSSKRTFYSRTRNKFSNLTFKTQRASGIGIFTQNN